MGDSFTVVNRATTGFGPTGTQKFDVEINKNLKITNYKPQEGRKAQAGDLEANFFNGGQDITVINSNGKAQRSLKSVDLSSSKYTIFQELVKLDGNDKNLTEQDLAKAKKLIGKYGITNVRRDAEAGVTTIVMEGGGILRFDFETDAEKKAK